jgi:hypothetical protein
MVSRSRTRRDRDSRQCTSHLSHYEFCADLRSFVFELACSSDKNDRRCEHSYAAKWQVVLHASTSHSLTCKGNCFQPDNVPRAAARHRVLIQRSALQNFTPADRTQSCCCAARCRLSSRWAGGSAGVPCGAAPARLQLQTSSSGADQTHVYRCVARCPSAAWLAACALAAQHQPAPPSEWFQSRQPHPRQARTPTPRAQRWTRRSCASRRRPTARGPIYTPQRRLAAP